MRIEAKADGLTAALRAIEGDIAHGVTQQMRLTVDVLKSDLRQQVTQAGLSPRLANTWRGQAYPKGRNSLSPAGYVYSNAPDIISSFVSGATIVPVHGARYLAIPSKDVPNQLGRRGASKKMTPEEVEVAFNQDLIIRKGKGSHLLAFVNVLQSRNKRGWRQATPGRVAQGRQAKLVLMFTLVRSVKMPKLLNLEAPLARAQAELAAGIGRL